MSADEKKSLIPGSFPKDATTDKDEKVEPEKVEQEKAAAVAPEVPAIWRYSILGLSCMLAFGGYLVFDLCSTLQVKFLLHVSEFPSLGPNNESP